MNNYSGIVYRIGAFAGPIFILGLVLVFIALKRPLPEKKSEMLFAVVVIAVSILLGGFYVYKSIHPTILCHKGYIVEVRRYPKVPFTDAYVFSNEDDDKPIFYLDSFSKKDILTNEFLPGVEYQIFYEETTKIIVRVETCNE